MPDTTSVAAPQPAPTAQPSGDVKTNGPANATAAQFARRFMESAKQTEAPVAETAQPAAEASPTAVTEEAQAPAVEKADPEVKVEAPAETETEEQADEALSKSTSLTPEQQAVIDKRIGKAVAKQRKAERDLAEMKLKLAEQATIQSQQIQPQPEAPSLIPLPPGAPPLANIETVQALTKLQGEAKQAIRFAEDALADIGDGNPPPEGWDKRTLREVMRNARVTLEDHIPQRLEFLTTRQQMQQKAYDVLPFLKDQQSTDYKAAQAIYARHPFLRNIPEGDFTVGLIVEGIKAVEARNAAAKAPPSTANKPVISKAKPSGDQTTVSIDGSSARVPAGTAAQRALAQEDAKLAAKGGVSQKDYAASLSRKAQLRNSS